MEELPFSKDRCAPDKPNVLPCCKTPGNLEWMEKGSNPTSRNFVGTCKVCGSNHYVMRPKPILLKGE